MPVALPRALTGVKSEEAQAIDAPFAVLAPSFRFAPRRFFRPWAYRSVLSVCWQLSSDDDTHATTTVWQRFPSSDSCSTCVSRDWRNGAWLRFPSNDRITSLSASRLVLICRPSMRVVLSVSALSSRTA